MRPFRTLLPLAGAAFALAACDSRLPPEPEATGGIRSLVRPRRGRARGARGRDQIKTTRLPFK